MKNNLSLFTLIGVLLLSIGSIAQPYCSSSYTVPWQDYISNVNFNTIANPTGPSGYSDFTAINSNIDIGLQYNLSTTIVNFGVSPIYVVAWIDWNQDFDFNDPGESFTIGNVVGPTFGTTISANILVPAGANVGATRLRISASRGFVPTPCNSGGYLFGETEDYSVTVFSPPVYFYWDGDVDNQWNNPLNWDNDILPSVSDPVIIPGTAPQFPIFNGPLYVGVSFGANSCKSLVIENGASLTITGTGTINIFYNVTVNSGGTLTVRDLNVNALGGLYINGGTVSVSDECTFTNTGNMTSGILSVGGLLEFLSGSTWVATGGTVICKGSSDTEIINSSLIQTIYDLTIESGGTARLSGDSERHIFVNGNFTIEPNSEFTLEAPNGGTNICEIVLSNTLTVDGDNSGKGSFVNEGGVITVYGTSEVKSYYEEDRWHFISSPVTSAVSGVFLDLYLKAFDEPTNSYTPSPGITSTTYPLGVGQGFETFSDIGNVTVSYVGGPLNTGDISPSVTGTDSNGGGIGDGEGWNLIGNPYPSAIDIGTDAIPVPGYTWSNIDNTVYAWNGTNWSSFNRTGTGTGTNGGNNILPSMQGFFVKATTTAPSLTIPNSARLHSSQANYKSSENNSEIRLTVNGNGYSDEMIVRALDNASDLFDSKYDAYKLPGLGEVPQLYSKAGSSNLSINSLPEFKEESIIPVYLSAGTAGLYTIETNDFDLSNVDLKVYLEDLKEGSIISLDDNNKYEFSSDLNDNEYRFNLIFKSSINNSIEISSAHIFSYDDLVCVKKEAGLNSHIFVYDMMGREVIRRTNNLDNEVKVHVSTGTGNYIVKLITDNYTETKKVFIK